MQEKKSYCGYLLELLFNGGAATSQPCLRTSDGDKHETSMAQLHV